MKYIVHYGYFECDGMKILDSKKAVRNLIKEESKGRSKSGLYFEIYEVNSIKKLKLSELDGE